MTGFSLGICCRHRPADSAVGLTGIRRNSRMRPVRFALNHMCAPHISLDTFFSLAESLGIDSVEIRNDLAGNAVLDGTPATAVKEAAERHGLTIISINALQRFNEWNDTRTREAAELIAYARD